MVDATEPGRMNGFIISIANEAALCRLYSFKSAKELRI